MGIEDFPSGETPPDQNLDKEDRTKEKIDEAEIKTGEKTELTEKEKLEQKEAKAEILKKVNNSIDGANEKLDQEAENLPEEKRKIFEGFTKNAKEALEKASRFVKDLIKDYKISETLAAGSAISGVAAFKLAEAVGSVPNEGGAATIATSIVAMFLGGLALEAAIMERAVKKSRIEDERLEEESRKRMEESWGWKKE